jgi:hypothetical protein
VPGFHGRPRRYSVLLVDIGACETGVISSRSTDRCAGAGGRYSQAVRRADGKILSLFEPATRVIGKGQAGKPNEFSKMVKLQEAENQIVTDYEVYDRRPSDSDLLIGAVEAHQARLGRTPRLVAADAVFYSAKNEVAVKAKGVKRVCISPSLYQRPERKREQKAGSATARNGGPDVRDASA